MVDVKALLFVRLRKSVRIDPSARSILLHQYIWIRCCPKRELNFESHLPQTIELVDRHPNQIFIVDHIAKPSIRKKALNPWRQQLIELASRPNVYCKLSGMVTEAHWDLWTEQELTPYFETVLEAFGCKRTMFGSDWPVVNLAATYGRWLETVQRALSQFSEEERAWVFAGTAVEAYNL